MALSFFKQFAIDNNLTVDYGFTYGKYKGFYISIKESLGSNRTLNIITNLAKDKAMLKEVLSVYDQEEFAKYCIRGNNFNEKYLQFEFGLTADKNEYVVEFLDKFIQSCNDHGLSNISTCPICGNPLLDGEEISIIDMQGMLMPVHDACFNKGKEELKEEVKEKTKEINKDRKGYLNGFLGALVFSLIYIGVIILAFLLVQFFVNNIDTESDQPFSSNVIGVNIFQYASALVGLAASPIVNRGYEVFKGKKGSGKFLIILPLVIISSLLGVYFGFVVSLVFYNDYDFLELTKLVFELLTPSKGYATFRNAFIVYPIVTILLSLVSLLFTFNNKKEQAEANASTFEKLE